jgi:hypothetical protein
LYREVQVREVSDVFGDEQIQILTDTTRVV